MAPEILKFNKYTDKADIWSLGVIIYTILVRKHPYPASDIYELTQNIKNKEKIKIPSSINKSMQSLLSRLLIKNPNNRISWNEIFRHKWFLKYKNKLEREKRIRAREKNKLAQTQTLMPKRRSIVYSSSENNLTKHVSIPIQHSKLDSYSDADAIFKFDEEEIIKNKRDLMTDQMDPPLIRDTIDDNYEGTVSQSMYINPRLQRHETEFKEYDDCKVYSRSCPGNYNFHENYIGIMNSRSKKGDNGYKILGESPNIGSNDSGLYGYLTKSVSTLKNFFRFS